MIGALNSSKNGKSWLEWMGKGCIRKLDYIESKLSPLWLSGVCYPSPSEAILPLAMLHRDQVRLVVICKEPYRGRNMACGVPILSKSGLMTPSSNIFKGFIESYWDGVTNSNYMQIYYNCRILVLNSSWTIGPLDEDRYDLTESHYPLWTNFMVPFVRKLSDDNVPIVALGIEAKGLVRDIESTSDVVVSGFPSDIRSIGEFTAAMSSSIASHVFNITHP
jgi:uracil DNA glycosylase